MEAKNLNYWCKIKEENKQKWYRGVYKWKYSKTQKGHAKYSTQFTKAGFEGDNLKFVGDEKLYLDVTLTPDKNDEHMLQCFIVVNKEVKRSINAKIPKKCTDQERQNILDDIAYHFTPRFFFV
jgi:hypothetical protein